ncbi:Uncharacterised protein [Candidatus Gugararchaeum adminiculabundum]|nr:Uncharacterised protein [Candidatus Gugararchaeum adminiculabundum]
MPEKCVGMALLQVKQIEQFAREFAQRNAGKGPVERKEFNAFADSIEDRVAKLLNDVQLKATKQEKGLCVVTLCITMTLEEESLLEYVRLMLWERFCVPAMDGAVVDRIWGYARENWEIGIAMEVELMAEKIMGVVKGPAEIRTIAGDPIKMSCAEFARHICDFFAKYPPASQEGKGDEEENKLVKETFEEASCLLFSKMRLLEPQDEGPAGSGWIGRKINEILEMDDPKKIADSALALGRKVYEQEARKTDKTPAEMSEEGAVGTSLTILWVAVLMAHEQERENVNEIAKAMGLISSLI